MRVNCRVHSGDVKKPGRKLLRSVSMIVGEIPGQSKTEGEAEKPENLS